MTLITPPGSDRTAYDRVGPADGEVVILIHGLGLSRAIWQPFIDHFGSRYQVIAYDLYGHGESQPAPATPSLGLFARQIVDLMDHCGVESAHMIGFSIGGMINRRLAMDHPDRCRSLAILNSPHDRGVDGQKQVEERAMTVRDDGKMATLAAALERWFTPAFRADHPETVDQVRQWREITDDESYAGAAWVLAHGVRELIRPKPPLALPTCVITASHDTGSTPAMAEQIAAEIEGAACHIIPGLQHLGLMERPDLYQVLLDEFLNRLDERMKA